MKNLKSRAISKLQPRRCCSNSVIRSSIDIRGMVMLMMMDVKLGVRGWWWWMYVKLGMGCFKAGRALSGGLKGCRCAGAASTSALCTVMLCRSTVHCHTVHCALWRSTVHCALYSVHCTPCRSSKHLPSDPSFCNFWKEELSRFDWEGVAAPALFLSLSSLCSIFLHSSCF